MAPLKKILNNFACPNEKTPMPACPPARLPARPHACPHKGAKTSRHDKEKKIKKNSELAKGSAAHKQENMVQTAPVTNGQ
jgi:hypothetical protein